MTTDLLDSYDEEYQESIPGDLYETHSFEWYINLLRGDPKVARNAHQRLADMFEYYGSEEADGGEYSMYRFATEDPLGDGANTFFGRGVHEAITEFVNKVRSGARGLGPEKRILLLLGPVGSGKSDVDRQIRRYFEDYTSREEGRMYTWEWTDLCSVIDDQDPSDDTVRSPMTQDPLVLLPQKQREDLLSKLNEELDAPYTLKNEQSLDPESEFYMDKLLEHYGNSLADVLRNHVNIVRHVASENRRQSIETFEPKDKKNQDETELTGDVNYSKLAIYGESDPRAFDYSGAFCNANRGLFSGEELLKLQREFLYDFLHATQEKTIKPKNNPRIDIDQVIVGRTNMPEYRDKKTDDKMEAFNDRTKRVDFPYVLEYTEEAEVYDKMLRNASVPEVHVEPHTLKMAALFAVMTRIEEPSRDDVTLLQKAKAYDPSDGSSEVDDVDKLREEADGEGMDGVSARFIGDEIANAVIETLEDEETPLSPLTVFSLLEENLESHGSIPEDNYSKYHTYIESAKEEYKERAIDDVREALAYNNDEIQRQGEKYMEHVVAYVNDDSVEDDLTGKPQEPDEKFMRSIEKELEVTEDRKDDFRQEMSNWVSRRARKGKSFNPQDNNKLLRALERKIWSDKRHNINFSALVRGSDSNEESSEWVDSLMEKGYSRRGAEELLEYAGAEVAKSELEEET